MTVSKMFPFITHTWNPVKYCAYGCTYCWAKKYGLDAYPKLYTNRLNQRFPEGAFVFVGDVGDLFHDRVPFDWIDEVFGVMAEQPLVNFLLLTKNPARYEMCAANHSNVYYGVTIETDRDDVARAASKAPPPSERLKHMKSIRPWVAHTFVSVEPVMDFTPAFADRLIALEPWAVAVGYDNYGNGLPEPTVEEVLRLASRLEEAGIKVYRKTIRGCPGDRDPAAAHRHPQGVPGRRPERPAPAPHPGSRYPPEAGNRCGVPRHNEDL